MGGEKRVEVEVEVALHGGLHNCRSHACHGREKARKRRRKRGIGRRGRGGGRGDGEACVVPDRRVHHDTTRHTSTKSLLASWLMTEREGRRGGGAAKRGTS